MLYSERKSADLQTKCSSGQSLLPDRGQLETADIVGPPELFISVTPITVAPIAVSVATSDISIAILETATLSVTAAP